MARVFKNKRILAAFFITFSIVLFFVIFGNNNFANGLVKTIFSPVLTVTSKISNSAGEIKDYFLTIKFYREENDKLKRELINLKKDDRGVAELKAENERLTKLLNLKNSIGIKTVSALVVSYEFNNGYDNFIINKGSNNSVSKGSVVISNDGLVGKTDEVGIGWTRVLTLLNPDVKVGVRIVRTGALAMAEGDRELSSSGLFRLTFIDKNMDIMVGDVLETTGDAGVYPEDITVGVVLEIKKDNKGERYAVVEPSVDFSSLYEVLVKTETVE